MRSCILPGAASNVIRPGVLGAAADAADAAPLVAAAGAPGSTLPRKYGEPSGAAAISETRVGSSLALRSPGGRTIGSHTKVTFVLPFSPRDVPIHVRTTLARLGRAVAAVIAASTGFGVGGFGGASARAVCSALSAQ